MTSKTLLLIAVWKLMLSWQQVYYPEGKRPETQPEYVMRLGNIAQQLVDEAVSGHSKLDPIDQVVIVATLFDFESALDYSVHHGPPLVSPIGTQDHGRARCLGQIQHTPTWMTRVQWESLSGLSADATARCVYWTNDMFWIQARHCLDKKRRWADPLSTHDAIRLFAGYGQGLSCVPKTKHYTRGTTFFRARNKMMRELGREVVFDLRKQHQQALKDAAEAAQ